ncbi:hypothetical protein DFH11DRAFT_1632106 [Phellopilus nigrolimitatus]|nr:hypothetical protein DFH11DRAFT_1632106 [Phellopilus nigrolimitatus]
MQKLNTRTILILAYLLTRRLSTTTYADIHDEHNTTSRFPAVRASLQLTRFIEGQYLQASLAQRILKMSHDQTVQLGPVNGGLEQDLDTHQDEGRRYKFLIADNNSGVILLDMRARRICWEYHPPARGYPNGPVDVVDIGVEDAAGGESAILVITLADAYETGKPSMIRLPSSIPPFPVTPFSTATQLC